MRTRDETIACSVGIDDDPAFGAVTPPIYLSANYSFAGFREPRAYDYTRSGNPTRDQLADALAKLERGAGAVVTGSGMSAIHLVLSLVPTGALVMAPHDCYGGTWRLLQALHERKIIDLAFADLTNPDALDAAFARRPFLVWVESPSNPLMRITDIRAVVARAESVGALVAVDNTFLSPILQKPLLLGAHFAVHSTTKYLNGHSDVLGGAVVAAGREHVEQLAAWANCTGVTGAPFDAWLTLRGLRTLGIRIARQEETATAVARFLGRHSRVKAVHYPGLATHPGHDVAREQQYGFGGMLSFELEDDSAAREVVSALKLLTLAESLGGVESLVCHPASMTHACLSAEAKAACGITPGLLRLSVGLEAKWDIVGDLAQALSVLDKEQHPVVTRITSQRRATGGGVARSVP
ncbi:MAG TPA: cystathionine gamma-synthase [Rhizomicrobium sp.]|jgi:cystathionine gamma-synthase|nr:cystathionine gamma-synthase [Rhizomicrobium sp.]